MRKKLIASVATLCLSAGVLSACGSNADSNDTKGGKSVEISIFAGSLPEASPTGEGVKAMIAALDKANVGIKATGFYDTSLGDATTMIQGLQQGTIDVGVAGNAYYSGLVPQVQVFELPFLFEDIEEARKITAPGKVRDEVFKHFDNTDIVGLSLWEGGIRQLSNNKRPVKTPEDLKGIKIRTLPAPIQQAAWKEMGALPQAIDSAELYTALQQGTVEAQENPLYEIEFRKFYEVQKYISMTSHVYTPFTMGVSRATWNKLNDEQKKALQDAAEVGREAQLAANDKANAAAKDKLIANGIKFEENPDRAAFKELAVKVWSMFTEKNGSELLDMIQGK